MKVNMNIAGFNISANGMSVQRKKMNLIAENIANADVRMQDGEPYKRKFLEVISKQPVFDKSNGNNIEEPVKMLVTRKGHLNFGKVNFSSPPDNQNMIATEKKDNSEGDTYYMPDNPAADENGYVKMSNVNIINEMVDMIAATRNYEANLTAFNSAKQIAKDSLEI